MNCQECAFKGLFLLLGEQRSHSKNTAVQNGGFSYVSEIGESSGIG